MVRDSGARAPYDSNKEAHQGADITVYTPAPNTQMIAKGLCIGFLFVFSCASLAAGTNEVFQQARNQVTKGKEIAYAIIQPMHQDKLRVLAQCQLERRFAEEMEIRESDSVSAIASDTVRAKCNEITDQIVEASYWLPEE